jgi:hypothetical protein
MIWRPGFDVICRSLHDPNAAKFGFGIGGVYQERQRCSKKR